MRAGLLILALVAPLAVATAPDGATQTATGAYIATGARAPGADFRGAVHSIFDIDTEAETVTIRVTDEVSEHVSFRVCVEFDLAELTICDVEDGIWYEAYAVDELTFAPRDAIPPNYTGGYYGSVMVFALDVHPDGTVYTATTGTVEATNAFPCGEC